MSDVPNTRYITINKDGIFVGGKPATTYRGVEIKFIDDIKESFANTQSRNPKVQELHVGAFDTKGKCSEPGIPSGKFGSNAWGRAKLFNGRTGPWVFLDSFSSASVCANYCAYNCGYRIRSNSVRSAVLDFDAEDEANTKYYSSESGFKQILQTIDLSKFVGKKIELNGYVLTVQKQK